MLIDAVVIFLLLMLAGAVPMWPHSRNWGYYPSAGVGILLAIVVVLLLIHII
jgi:low affinity Fe/Cu permease